MEGSTNLQLASSNAEDVNLSRDNDRVNLKLMLEKMMENLKVADYLLIKFQVISQLFYLEFQFKMQANR